MPSIYTTGWKSTCYCPTPPQLTAVGKHLLEGCSNGSTVCTISQWLGLLCDVSRLKYHVMRLLPGTSLEATWGFTTGLLGIISMYVCFSTRSKKKHKKAMVANRLAHNPKQLLGFTWLMSRNITMLNLILFFTATAKTLHMQLLFRS